MNEAAKNVVAIAAMSTAIAAGFVSLKPAEKDSAKGSVVYDEVKLPDEAPKEAKREQTEQRESALTPQSQSEVEAYRARIRAVTPTTEQAWEAEPVDPAFQATTEPDIFTKVSAIEGVQGVVVSCRSVTCKVDVNLKPGATLGELGAGVPGLSPYKQTESGWVFFYDPELQ